MGAPRDTRDSQVSQAGPKFKAVPKRDNERIIREFLRRSGYFKKVNSGDIVFTHILPSRSSDRRWPSDGTIARHVGIIF